MSFFPSCGFIFGLIWSKLMLSKTLHMINTKKDEIIILAEACAILGLYPNTWDNKGFQKVIRLGTRKDCRY